MAQQSVWIRQNMLPSPNFKLENGKNQFRRPLSEAELKVQRALEKLSIPEWYLNNSSKPPKFLKHDTPIDSRLPSWRTTTCNKTKNASSSPILNERKLSGASKENALNNSSQKTPTKNNKSETEKKPAQIINRLDTWQIRSPTKVSVNYTQSFPKISPSRKIENINIVFPQPPQLNTDENDKTQDKNLSSLMNKSSLNESNLNESQVEKFTVRITEVDKLLESSMTQSLNETNELKMNNNSLELPNNKRYKTPNSPNLNSPSAMKNKFELKSEKGNSPVSLSTIIGENLLALSSFTSENNEEVCDDCKTDVAITPSSRYLPVTTSFKARCKLMPIDEDKETNSKSRSTSIGSSTAFMESTKKSAALEQIVKRKMNSGNGLIQEIIQEFQKKCVKNDNPTFTKGSKKFVKKLVKSLEKSIHEDENETIELKEKNKFDEKSNDILQLNKINVNYSDRYSVSSSATISLKSSDNDSGGSEPPSPTLSPSPDYNWSTKVRADIENDFKKTTPKKYNNVQWIPLPTDANLPRASSALSMKSRSSSRSSSSNKSPCISPISEDNSQQRFFSNKRPYWNWSHGINDMKTRRGSVGERYTVCDSGYADQASEHSIMIQSFLAEYEASHSFIHETDTSTDRRLSFSRASSILSRSVRV